MVVQLLLIPRILRDPCGSYIGDSSVEPAAQLSGLEFFKMASTMTSHDMVMLGDMVTEAAGKNTRNATLTTTAKDYETTFSVVYSDRKDSTMEDHDEIIYQYQVLGEVVAGALWRRFVSAWPVCIAMVLFPQVLGLSAKVIAFGMDSLGSECWVENINPGMLGIITEYPINLVLIPVKYPFEQPVA